LHVAATPLSRTLDVLENIAHPPTFASDNSRRIPGLIKIDSLQRRLEGSHYILIGVAEQAKGEFLFSRVERASKFDLPAGQSALALEMQMNVWSAAIRTEQGNCVDAIVAAAFVTDESRSRSRRAKRGFGPRDCLCARKAGVVQPVRDRPG
jgi:hypothetical protein